jgi:hypothetical protein
MTTHTTDMHTTTHVIVGNRDQVSAALHRAHADGRLHRITEAVILPGHKLRVTAQLTDPPPPRTLHQRLRPWLVTLAVLAGIGTVAGLVWLVALAVMAVVALVTTIVTWLWAHAVLICLAILGLLLLSGGASCAGIHCGGCGR